MRANLGLLQVLTHFLDAYASTENPTYSQDQLVAAAKLLICPMLEKAFDEGEMLLDQDILNSMIKHIFDAPDDTAGARLKIEEKPLIWLFGMFKKVLQGSGRFQEACN